MLAPITSNVVFAHLISNSVLFFVLHWIDIFGLGLPQRIRQSDADGALFKMNARYTHQRDKAHLF
jgi:hypothetical protein